MLKAKWIPTPLSEEMDNQSVAVTKTKKRRIRPLTTVRNTVRWVLAAAWLAIRFKLTKQNRAKLKAERLRTQHADERGHRPERVREAGAPRFRLVYIMWKTAQLFLILIWLAGRGKLTKQKNAEAVRDYLESLGFLWIKAGQLLSLRRDIFSKEFCLELSNLQFQAVGFSPELARQTIEHELQQRISDVFSEYESRPFAAASLSQVHKARLRCNGCKVVIKIQRPNVSKIFRQDMRLLRFFAWMLNLVPSFRFLNLSEGVWELETILREETDYRFEASNIARARKELRKHRVYVPKVFRTVSTEKILVMEFLDAVLMSEFIKVQRSDPNKVDQWLKDNEIEPKKVGQRLFLSFLRQLFEGDVFHGDLHPGNIMLLKGSRIAFIDLGTVGSMEAEWLKKYYQSLLALVSRDYDKAADFTLLLSPHLPPIDLSPVKDRMVRIYKAWEQRSALKNLPYEEKSMTNIGMEISKVLFEFKIMSSWSIMKMDRTWGTLDASLQVLIPEVNYAKLYARYIKERQSRILKVMFNPKTFRSTIASLPEKVGEYEYYIENLFRRSVRMFQGTQTRISAFFEITFSGIANALLLSGVFFLWAYLYKFHNSMVDGITPSFVAGLIEELPQGKVHWWMLGGFIDLYLFFLAYRIKRSFSQREVVNQGVR